MLMFSGSLSCMDTKIMRIDMNNRQKNLITLEDDGPDV